MRDESGRARPQQGRRLRLETPTVGRALGQDALRRRLLVCADVAALCMSMAAAAAIGRGIALLFWFVIALPLWIFLAKIIGLYDRDHRSLRHLTVDELPSLLTWATTGTAAASLLTMLVTTAEAPTASVLRFYVCLLIVAPIARAVARRAWRGLTPPQRTLLVGSGPLEQATRRKVELFHDIHLEITGTLDADAIRGIAEAEPAPGNLRDIGGSVPDRIIVATDDVSETLLVWLVRTCKVRRIKLSVVPPVRGMFGTAVRLTHVADLPFIEYHTWDPSRSTMLLKRVLDVIVAGLLLALLLPFLTLVAVLIRLDSRGPAFFRQVRAGKDGRPFAMLKFRTMNRDAEAQLATLVDVETLADPMFKFRKDPRVTRLGRVLRRWSLDELPQLVNVLRGDMSLVGPRPEELALVRRYRPQDVFRLGAKPGLTGPMQVYGRGELNFDERLAIEREYIENQSLARDLRLLLLTLPAVTSGKGAF